VICVSAISYLNTVPFVYGLENHSIRKDIDLQFHTPAESARRLMEGKADIGIIPTAVIPYVKNNMIIPGWCIGAEGKVASVLLCSGKPLEKIETLYLDSESRTSAMLTRILSSSFWKISPEFKEHSVSADHVDFKKSYLLIGDKALRLGSKFEYVYDLAEEWLKFKELPFVFACWTANRELDPGFVKEFNEALELGVNNIESAVEAYRNGFSREYALKYLAENVSYRLTDTKKRALNEFWRLAMAEYMSKVRWVG